MERKYQYRGSATVLLCQSVVYTERLRVKDAASRCRCRLGSCKIILEIFRQKECQQFRLKKSRAVPE